MSIIKLTSHVGADGVLRLNVPLGTAQAHREVKVTVRPDKKKVDTQREQAEWGEFVRGTAGCWQGEPLKHLG